ncbi:16S rRNA (cytosine(1402)-N(4))-methyltransferase RsmH [Patescibacteria group bacterium]|nr:16S rRNA (cytosine(1402)-N(4))-methyltransferase RsmH [Patescibacteria group bacterium]MBU4141335.1 16S rRNA (cytosine(1402)-N(4))-methyltransferase RsmH [Patescibacteria group bacterium]
MNHAPVLLKEVIEYLNPKSGDNFVDATVGDGGHAKEILKRTAPDGKLLGIDKDLNSIKIAEENLKEFKDRFFIAHGNFLDIKKIAADNPQIGKISGVLADLGLSSRQIEESGRGFSFQRDEPLIMSMVWPLAEGRKIALQIVNEASARELEKIFKEYGEERLARPIAERIFRAREAKRIERTFELADIAVSAYKKFFGNKTWRIHPATKIFMALRISVNEELSDLENFLPDTLSVLAEKGRLGVISFHSLEDRIVKNFFRKESHGCICDKNQVECVCDHMRSLKIITKRPAVASADEMKKNPRSRSAKLRVAEKLSALSDY